MFLFLFCYFLFLMLSVSHTLFVRVLLLVGVLTWFNLISPWAFGKISASSFWIKSCYLVMLLICQSFLMLDFGVWRLKSQLPEANMYQHSTRIQLPSEPELCQYTNIVLTLGFSQKQFIRGKLTSHPNLVMLCFVNAASCYVQGLEGITTNTRSIIFWRQRLPSTLL